MIPASTHPDYNCNNNHNLIQLKNINKLYTPVPTEIIQAESGK